MPYTQKSTMTVKCESHGTAKTNHVSEGNKFTLDVSTLLSEIPARPQEPVQGIRLGSIRKSVFIPKEPPISDNGKIISTH